MKSLFKKSSLVKIGLWAGALLMGIYLAAIIFGSHGLLALNSMQQELSAIKKENARIEQENIDLYRKIRRLENDSEYIEQVARQELYMVAPGEIVFRFEEKKESLKNE
ncbi:MAG: septum formation initiator family protein [Desulfobacterales bacterium]|nr:septum formation initiator family protein [Desulfobacterales bacterium]